ncbi:hypothetical protein MCOR02_006134 [Pyricularia oryzae]|nr:hypothetical protein MCOR02_006134 [Pyricularia oryzae]KAI6261635.1 hypothetical protein MCOR19_002084 [Pyricularia oryzae]KAI6331602.1 hypothetical protein MCOR29_001547 [Pyricularia oryzae]KAI6345805.1 hypothetical protein MCOR28_003324 [Pyricularia oryzae]
MADGGDVDLGGSAGPQAWKASFAKGKPSVTQRDGVTSKFGPTVGSGLWEGGRYGKPKAAYGMPAKQKYLMSESIATRASLACIHLPPHGQACFALCLTVLFRLYENGFARVHAEPPCHTLKEGFCHGLQLPSVNLFPDSR